MAMSSGWTDSWRRRLAFTGLFVTLFAATPAAAQPEPSVTFVPEDFPPEVLIGEKFTFTVEFSNQGDQSGAGPYIALCLPAPGADGRDQNEPCDGFFFVSAVALFTGQTLSLQPAGPPLIQSPPGSPIACQGLTQGSTNPLCKPPISLPPGFEGCQVVFLPLGGLTSFYPDQPPVRVQITLQVHSFADPGKPLPVKVIGGFQSDSSGTGCLEGDTAVATTLPTLFKVRKRYLGPENETVTGPNFPQPYKIEVDVADGQTLDPLLVTEDLPDSLVYLGPYDNPPVESAPLQGTPNGQVVLNFGKVTGTASDTDASFEFKFFAADKDADGNPVLDPQTCKGKSLAVDDVWGTAGWDPLDTRDKPGPVPVTSDATPEDHRLELECLAVQKNVAPLGPRIPGDELVYTLSFQVSDYVQARNVVVRDLLSDGLEFLAQPAPTLTFADKNGLVQGTFTLGTDAIVDDSAKHPCGDGSTLVRFDVSKALAALTAGVPGASPFHQAGILTGGEVGPFPPSVPVTGTITFHARIADEFDCPVPSKDQSVDKHDRVINQAAIAGEVLELAGERGDVTAEDETLVAVTEIAHGTVEKSIVARNGDPDDPLLQRSPPLFAPGDTVTFRLSYCFPSGDAEDFRLEDFLPSPVFNVSDPSQVTDVILGPKDTLGIFPKPCPDKDGKDPAPAGFADASRNSVCFSFGSFDDPDNERACAEILFTVPVTAEPFADGLVPTNMVSESERNSFKELFDQIRIEQFAVGQPVVRVSKGAVSACCGSPSSFLCTESVGTFTPETIGPVFFNGPVLPCGVRFAPPLTSAGLAVTPVQSDVTGGVRPGDRILFAVVVENTGFSPNGAFDVRVQESLPPGLRFPPDLQGGIALCVEDGAGNPLPYTGDLFGGGIELVDSGPTQGALASGAGNTTGSNLAVLTYILEVDPSLAAGTCAANRAAVASYAGTEGGKSHVAAGLGGPLQQGAEVCRKPALVKSLAVVPFLPLAVVTSEEHTQTNGEVEELTIGEIVRFRLVLEVPEGTLPNLRIEDPLPGGFTVLPKTVRVAFVSSGGNGLAASSLATGAGLEVAGDETTLAFVIPTFPEPPELLPDTVDQTQHGRLEIVLGNLTNSDRDCDREFVVIEFNALVGNDAVNQSGREAANTARARWDGQFVDSNPVKLRIVEPRLRIDKTMRERLDNPLARAVSLSITNEGTADAFDVVVTDELPASLFFELNTFPTVRPADGATVAVSGKKVEVKIDHIPVGGTVDVFFQVVLGGEVSCEATVNVADVTWTSLPGPNGTVNNPTNSVTPGASGADDGERNGGGGSVNTYHDRDAHSDFADCPPDLSVSKVCNRESAQLRCFIVVTNLGPGQAESVTLSDVLPPGIQTESGLISGSGWSCSGTQELTCSYAESLAPGEKTAELEILTKLFSGGWLLTGHNCAQAITQVDVNPANNFDCFGACPDGRGNALDDYFSFYNFPLDPELGDPCAEFAERPQDFCQGFTPFKGDCGCGCFFTTQPPPDIAVTKTCPAEGPGVCQILVTNVGAGSAVGTLTVTDTLPPGVTLLVPGISGTNWRCDVTAGQPKRITCTWEGPPLAPGETAPPVSLRLVPRPGAAALPKNCARATLLGDAKGENDLGCTKPPGCLEPRPPFIQYVSEDPAECAVMPFVCNRPLTFPFSNDCGCGCICPFGPWCR